MSYKRAILPLLALAVSACGPNSDIPNIKLGYGQNNGESIPSNTWCYETYEEGIKLTGFDQTLSDGNYIVTLERGIGFKVDRVDDLPDTVGINNINITVGNQIALLQFIGSDGTLVEIPMSSQSSNFYYDLELPEHLKGMLGLNSLSFTLDTYADYKDPTTLSMSGYFNGCIVGEDS